MKALDYLPDYVLNEFPFRRCAEPLEVNPR